MEEMSAILDIDDICCKYGSYNVLKEIKLSINKGDFVSIIGPNGSGKSTLLKTITRFVRPVKGVIFIDNINIFNFSDKQFAKKIGFVSQNYHFNFDFTVEDIILMGRNPHLNLLEKEDLKDYKIIEDAMILTDTLKFKDKKITQLSGGETQRVLIARALAQEPEILILDEPISHLDINYKFEILELLKTMNQEKNITIIIALHDINLASYYSEKIILLKEGSIFAAGEPEDIINKRNLKNVFNVDSDVTVHPVTNKPYITFVPDSTIINNKEIVNNKKIKIHVIGGGGQASFLIRNLHKKGYIITTGVLNIGDSDWKTAKQLSIKVIEEIPFAPISRERYYDNLELMKYSDLIVLENIPFGHGNTANLEGLLKIMETEDRSKKVYIIKGSSDASGDYTGGKGQRIYNKIMDKGAILVEDYNTLFSIIDLL